MPSNSECIMQYILLDSALHGLFYAFSIRAICGHPKFDYWKLPLLWHVPKGREYEIFKPLHGYFFRHKNPLSGNRTICIDLRVNLFFSSTLLLFVHLLVLIMSTILYRIRFADLICEQIFVSGNSTLLSDYYVWDVGSKSVPHPLHIINGNIIERRMCCGSTVSCFGWHLRKGKSSWRSIDNGAGTMARGRIFDFRRHLYAAPELPPHCACRAVCACTRTCFRTSICVLQERGNFLVYIFDAEKEVWKEVQVSHKRFTLREIRVLLVLWG